MELDKKKTAERDKRRQYAYKYYKKNRELLKLKRDIKKSEKRQNIIEQDTREKTYSECDGRLLYRTGEFIVSFK